MSCYVFKRVFMLTFVALFLWQLERTYSVTSLPHQKTDSCSNKVFYATSGVITNPTYPKPYKNHTSCMWHISGSPGDVITISFDDLDIEEEKFCRKQPCCLSDWVKIWSDDDDKSQYCGQNTTKPKPFISRSYKVSIKFHSALVTKGGRGFKLSYVIGPKNADRCPDGQIQCSNKKCILSHWQCNGVAECEDGSDEKYCKDYCLRNERKCGEGQGCYLYPKHHCDGIWHCDNGADEMGCEGCPANTFACSTIIGCYSVSKRCDGVLDCSDFSDELNCTYCGANMTRCGANSNQCYNPFQQRCDMVRDCSNGEDERGCVHTCPHGIQCPTDKRCYTLDEQCNGVAQCADSSDENNCSRDLCRSERGGFLCDNGHCIREAWKCDHTDDCGDSSDEINCLKNSVITAAVMGSLVCGLLLVIAVSCTCRLYALRTQETRDSSPDTPLFRLEEEFLYREPPPSYAVAVGSQAILVENHHCGSERHHSHRSRRLRRSRRRPPTPPPPIATNGQSDATSETSNSNSNSSSSPVSPGLPLSVRSLDANECDTASQSNVYPSDVTPVTDPVPDRSQSPDKKQQSPISSNKDKSLPLSVLAKSMHSTSQESGECIAEVHSPPNTQSTTNSSTESLERNTVCDTEPLIS